MSSMSTSKMSDTAGSLEGMTTNAEASTSKSPLPTPSLFPNYAIDQAFCGIGAGIVSTLCMHPLDLIKVQFQVSTSTTGAETTTSSHKGKGKAVERGVWRSTKAVTTTLSEMGWALREIKRKDGVKGLYRGLSPNLVGNASSWGFYFLWYTMLKSRMEGGDLDTKLSASQHLTASAESGIITAVITNPLWVVKTRMFTTTRHSPTAYRNVGDGLIRLAREEGFRGLSKGMLLAFFGVSNGAIQFMTYEELKRWRVDSRRRTLGPGSSEEDVKHLSNIEYILMSGSAKLVAIGITYPYQVIRSRIQYKPSTVTPYTSIPNCISRTYAAEGIVGFYKGLATNAVRILPGTCVTFVVYEQLSRFLARRAGSESRPGL